MVCCVKSERLEKLHVFDFLSVLSLARIPGNTTRLPGTMLVRCDCSCEKLADLLRPLVFTKCSVLMRLDLLTKNPRKTDADFTPYCFNFHTVAQGAGTASGYSSMSRASSLDSAAVPRHRQEADAGGLGG